MADHPNVELLRKGYAAFAAGDMATVENIFADDIVWHAPGNNPISGDFKGKEQVFGLFAKLMELTGGTFRQEIHDIVANDEHAVVLAENGAQRPDGRSWQGRAAHVWHVANGKCTEYWLFADDQAAADAFFSG